MAQLGARSRFEAGVLATLKGWVDQWRRTTTHPHQGRNV
jgi:hypothetical protein